MSNHSAKARRAANAREMRHLRVWIACTLLFQAARACLGGGWAAWAVLLAVGATDAWIHRWLARLAAPTYAPTGALVDGGAPLREGLPAYAFDVVYLAAFCVVASVATPWAWLVFLAVPAYAVYALWAAARSVLRL